MGFPNTFPAAVRWSRSQAYDHVEAERSFNSFIVRKNKFSLLTFNLCIYNRRSKANKEGKTLEGEVFKSQFL